MINSPWAMFMTPMVPYMIVSPTAAINHMLAILSPMNRALRNELSSNGVQKSVTLILVQPSQALRWLAGSHVE
jgi:hypothetical protein